MDKQKIERIQGEKGSGVNNPAVKSMLDKETEQASNDPGAIKGEIDSPTVGPKNRRH